MTVFQQQPRWTTVLAIVVSILAPSTVSGQELRSQQTTTSLFGTDTREQQQQQRQLRVKIDPHTTVLKVPKVIHFTIADEPPKHQSVVIDYSVKLAESHGFEVMIHHDSDIDAMIRSEYPTLVPPWEILLANDGGDRGARIGDFARLLILYHYGGVYLDGDMIPCHDLTELISEPGVASFPQINSYRKQILNSSMSSPPGHKVFWIALEIIRNMENFKEEHIMWATGPGLLAKAVNEYWVVTKTPAPLSFEDQEEVPEPPEGSKWVRAGDIRLGAVDYDGRGVWHPRGGATRSTLGLLHLHWRSWVNAKQFKKSVCDDDLDLIEAFLDHSCRKVERLDSVHWSNCGDGSELSGMQGWNPEDDKLDPAYKFGKGK